LKLVSALRARELLKDAVTRHPSWVGREVIEPADMRARYPDFYVPCAEELEVNAPEGTPIDGTRAPELEPSPRHYDATAVYRLPRAAFRRLDVLESGGALVEGKYIPNTGVGNQSASILTSVKPSLRRTRKEACVVAPWPHLMPASYGDFMLHILPRICRVWNRLDKKERSEAIVAYPLAHARWEAECLQRLGLTPERMIDTRVTRVSPAPGGVVYAPSGEGVGWQNRSAHPDDYRAAREALWPGSTPGRSPSRRLYLQRKGRRRLLNEDEALAVLKPHGFETIDLEGLTVAEQMAMIADASIILGVHGANMINMIWCSPGAKVVEFFNRGFRPSFNWQMAFNLSLDYYYLAEQPMEPYAFSALNWDVHVDVGALGRFLEQSEL
jgi:hypothetical protein